MEGSDGSTKWLNEAFEIGKHIPNQTPGKDALALQSPSNRAVQGRLLLQPSGCGTATLQACDTDVSAH